MPRITIDPRMNARATMPAGLVIRDLGETRLWPRVRYPADWTEEVA
jgi:hypothetical protein